MPRFLLNVVRRILIKDRRGIVAIFFALALVPIIVGVALAVDYSFYIQARAQLNLAADAAAMHAVRIASQAYSEGQTTLAAAEAAGMQAGQQWFAAQLGTISSASVSSQNLAVSVTYQASPPGFLATVSYQGSVPTHLGSFIVPSWQIAGSSGSIVESAYLEVVMFMDNSSSMLIGSTDADILNLEYLTPCSAQGQATGQWMQWSATPPAAPNYTWLYSSNNIGYSATGANGYGQNGFTPPPKLNGNATNGQCNSLYTGSADDCFYPPTRPDIMGNGYCTNGNIPVSPCGLACHSDTGNNDYYYLAKSNGITLRLDVVHQAAASVIQTMQSYEQVPGQYSVGVYEFNNTLQQQYPPTGGGEASTDLATALTTVNALSPPITADANTPDTSFGTTASALAASLTPAGDGTSAAAPLKNIIIVTDGMEDDPTNGRYIGPITSATNESICQKFKDLGFTVFVLYTKYLPLPNQYYLYGNTGAGVTAPRLVAEPIGNNTDQITQSLSACASTPQDFFSASNSAEIVSQMQNILKAAINGPGRVTH